MAGDSNYNEDGKAAAEQSVALFRFERLLNQDQAGRRLALLGKVKNETAILLAERAAFTTNNGHLSRLAQSLEDIKNLGANDIYSWFLARDGLAHQNLKINLIHPCTEKHIAKYSVQGVRMVTETPSVYSNHVHPWIKAQREAGRLNWVFNILDGKTEQEDVILRDHTTQAAQSQDNKGFLLLPDLNWDRKTITALHLLGIVERRDIWSVRDLQKRHIPWLKHMRQKLLDTTTRLYPQLESDQLKLYVHYQPTYYHFHVHVVHVMHEGGLTQAVGKALSLDNIISQLEQMPNGDDSGMHSLSFTYGLGEASELWKEIFEPLKQGKLLGDVPKDGGRHVDEAGTRS